MSLQAAMRKVPFNVLAPGVQAIRAELDAAVARVLDRGWFLMGPELEEFERQFAAYHGVDVQAVGVGSGTDALRIGLGALGIEAGDEVLVTANAGVPPTAAIVAAGARPVFCDVDPHTHTLDPDEIERHLSPRLKAVLLVHLYGHAAAMDPILERAHRHGLKVLEDCAQAHGARYRGRLVGTLGDAAAFSFYPTKNLGALGDAGAVISNAPGVIDRARLLRMYGWRTRYVSETHSTVSRMDEIQAAVLTAKLRRLDEWNARRMRIAKRYRANLDGVVDLPPADGVFHLFVVRTPHRDRLQAHLTEQGVGTDIHYPLPVHLQSPYAQYGDGPGSLPVTEQLARENFSLPLWAGIDAETQERVVDAVREALKVKVA